MIRAIQAIWDWLLSWIVGGVMPNCTKPALPDLTYWCVVWIDNGRYSIVAVYQEEDKARESYHECCRTYPDRYIWLIRVLDVHRPQAF